MQAKKIIFSSTIKFPLHVHRPSLLYVPAGQVAIQLVPKATRFPEHWVQVLELLQEVQEVCSVLQAFKIVKIQKPLISSYKCKNLHFGKTLQGIRSHNSLHRLKGIRYSLCKRLDCYIFDSLYQDLNRLSFLLEK